VCDADRRWSGKAVLVGALWELSRVFAGTGHRRGDLGGGGTTAGCSSVGLTGGDEVGERAVAPVCRCETAAIFSVI